MFISDKWYPVAKFIAQIGLPAVGTLYFALAAIWGLPFPERIIGSITALDTFLGVLLGISTKVYINSENRYAGALNVTKTPDKTLYSLELNSHPEELENAQEVVFKVAKNPSS